MHEATTIPTLTSDTSENLTAAARRAESWFGEPFLAPDEDPAQALAPGTARRAALDDAIAEIEAGLSSPSARWKVRYGRSEERRVGKECSVTCRSRWSPYH